MRLEAPVENKSTHLIFFFLRLLIRWMFDMLQVGEGELWNCLESSDPLWSFLMLEVFEKRVELEEVSSPFCSSSISSMSCSWLCSEMRSWGPDFSASDFSASALSLSSSSSGNRYSWLSFAGKSPLTFVFSGSPLPWRQGQHLHNFPPTTKLFPVFALCFSFDFRSSQSIWIRHCALFICLSQNEHHFLLPIVAIITDHWSYASRATTRYIFHCSEIQTVFHRKRPIRFEYPELLILFSVIFSKIKLNG